MSDDDFMARLSEALDIISSIAKARTPEELAAAVTLAQIWAEEGEST